MLGRVVILSGELMVFGEVFRITSLRWELGSCYVLFCDHRIEKIPGNWPAYYRTNNE